MIYDDEIFTVVFLWQIGKITDPWIGQRKKSTAASQRIFGCQKVKKCKKSFREPSKIWMNSGKWFGLPQFCPFAVFGYFLLKMDMKVCVKAAYEWGDMPSQRLQPSFLTTSAWLWRGIKVQTDMDQGQLVLSKGCSGCAPFKLFLETGELNLLSLFSKCSSNDLALLVLVLVPVVVEVVAVVSSQ